MPHTTDETSKCTYIDVDKKKLSWKVHEQVSSLKHVMIGYFIDFRPKSLHYFCSFSVLSDAAESLQQFREALCYSGTHQKMNELRSWATNYICKGKSPRHTYQQEFQGRNTLGWLPTEIFHQSFTVLWLTSRFLPSYLALQTPATNKFGNCFPFSHSFSGIKLFCDTSFLDPKTTSLSQDAEGVCVYYCGARREAGREMIISVKWHSVWPAAVEGWTEWP